jgi:hypothetical protein
VEQHDGAGRDSLLQTPHQLQGPGGSQSLTASRQPSGCIPSRTATSGVTPTHRTAP